MRVIPRKYPVTVKKVQLKHRLTSKANFISYKKPRRHTIFLLNFLFITINNQKTTLFPNPADLMSPGLWGKAFSLCKVKSSHHWSYPTTPALESKQDGSNHYLTSLYLMVIINPKLFPPKTLEVRISNSKKNFKN